MPEFRLDAPFQPTGDQPEAIRRLSDGLAKGMKQQTLLGATGTGKTFSIAQRHPERRQADAGAGPQQDARGAAVQRVPGLLPGQRGRVLRVLLRLLPARGVPAPQRHVHREGLVAQRRDRQAPPCGDAGAVRAQGRHHRGQRQLHLRPRRARGLRRDRRSGCAPVAATGATASCASWSTSSTSATTRHCHVPSSGSAATPWSSSPPTTTSSSGSSSSATRWSGSRSSTRSPASCSRSATSSTSTRPPTT